MKSDERAATAPTARALKWSVSLIAIAMSLYHMYVAGVGPPEAVIFRGTHQLFALTLVDARVAPARVVVRRWGSDD